MATFEEWARCVELLTLFEKSEGRSNRLILAFQVSGEVRDVLWRGVVQEKYQQAPNGETSTKRVTKEFDLFS